MPDTEDWSFPADLQPKQAELAFDLEKTFNSMVKIRAEIPEDAFTAPLLGTDRGGNGIVIRDEGVVLTIGYLITEAQSIWLTSNKGVVVPGYPLAYDQATGFGLIRALGSLGAPALARGSAAQARVDDTVYVVGHGGRRHCLKAKLSDKREFAGYWEYLLEEALFSMPAHPEWSGAALVSEAGLLLGVGSLLMQEAVDGRTVQGNMSVPIDLLEPILDSLLTTGRSGLPARPWLGLYAGETEGQLAVGGVTSGGPADKAGVQQGDLILEVAGTRVTTLGAFLRAVWAVGPAGARIPLTLARDGSVQQREIESRDRNDLLKRPQLH